MKYFYIIESRVYMLNGKQKDRLKKIYPVISSDMENFDEALQWIELNGTYLNTAECYNY